MSFTVPSHQPYMSSTVYVVIEITDPNMCFGINQKQYIKYDDKKQLSIIGIYEDRIAAETECAKSCGRYILSSEFHKSFSRQERGHHRPITKSYNSAFNFSEAFDFDFNKNSNDMDID